MIPLGIPEHTLGWGVLKWGSTYLAQPDGETKGALWEYTTEQAMFVLNFYAIDKEGKWLYNRAMLSRPKGWGKSPLLAAICCTELLGPVRFSHWDKNGNAVGKRANTPVIQLAAVTEDQAENTMTLVREMLSEGPAYDAYDLDIALSRVRAPGGGLIQRTTTSPRGAEGKRPTFAVLDETHHWIENESREFANTIRRNLGKIGGRSIETTNAPVPGEGSIAEDTDMLEERIRRGELERKMLYDSAEVYVEDIYDKEQAFAALKQVYGDAYWIDLDRVWAEINDPATSEADARRFYFNQRVIRGTAWLNPKVWDSLHNPDVRPLRSTDKIALGFRGQTRNGAAALVACRLEDSAIFVLKAWETPDNQKLAEIPYTEVDEFVRLSLEIHNVLLFFAAPQNWQDIVGRWYEENEDVVEEFWTNQRLKLAKAVEQFETAVYGGRITHDGSEVLTRHIENCQTEELPGELHYIRKATTHSRNYISVAEAAVLAFEAAQEAIQRGLEAEGPGGYVYSF